MASVAFGFLGFCGFWLWWLSWLLWLWLLAFLAFVAFGFGGFRGFCGFWLSWLPWLLSLLWRLAFVACGCLLLVHLWRNVKSEAQLPDVRPSCFHPDDSFGGFWLLVAFRFWWLLRTLAFRGFFAFSWLRLASVGFSCLHSLILIWFKYAWLFASYDSSQICLPIHLSVYIYLSISRYLSFYLFVYPSIYLYVVLSVFLYFCISFFLSFSLAAVIFSLFAFAFPFVCFAEKKPNKEASKQASTSCSPLDLVCCSPAPRNLHFISDTCACHEINILR